MRSFAYLPSSTLKPPCDAAYDASQAESWYGAYRSTKKTPYSTFTENVLMIGFSGRFFFIILYKNRLLIQIYKVKNIPDRMIVLFRFC